VAGQPTLAGRNVLGHRVDDLFRRFSRPVLPGESLTVSMWRP
jgi:hypothetical protein